VKEVFHIDGKEITIETDVYLKTIINGFKKEEREEMKKQLKEKSDG